jgi:hypothetical protein
MTMWQFSAAVAGWMRAHGQKTKRSDDLSDDDLRDMGIVGF